MSSTDTGNGDITKISQQQQQQGQGQFINSNPHPVYQVVQDGQTQYYFPPPPPPIPYTDENGNTRYYYPPPPPPMPIVVGDNNSNSNTKGGETNNGNSSSPKITFIILGVFLLLALIIVITIFTVKKIKRRKRKNSLKNLYKNEVDVKELTEDYKEYLNDDKLLNIKSPNDTLNNELYSPTINTISSLSLSPPGFNNTGFLNTNAYILDPNYDTSIYSLRAHNLKPIPSNKNFINSSYAISNEVLGNVSLTEQNQNSLLFSKNEPVVTDVIQSPTNSFSS